MVKVGLMIMFLCWVFIGIGFDVWVDCMEGYKYKYYCYMVLGYIMVDW